VSDGKNQDVCITDDVEKIERELRENFSANAARDCRRTFRILLDMRNGRSNLSEQTIAESFRPAVVVSDRFS
jgi:hypothetical protein